KFFFRKPKEAEPGGGGLGGIAAGAVASLTGGGPVELEFKDKLIVFRPRVSAAGQVSSVKVRAWDPRGREQLEGETDAASVSAKLDADPAALATAVAGPSLP